MGGNIDVFAAAKLADRFENACLAEVEDEADFFAVLNNVGAVAGRTRSRVVEGEALAVLEQEGLNVAGG